jgi:hypothetical protein
MSDSSRSAKTFVRHSGSTHRNPRTLTVMTARQPATDRSNRVRISGRDANLGRLTQTK